jgi:Rieske Fe-S protein
MADRGATDQMRGASQARRTFLHVCIGGMTVATAGAMVYPVVTFLRLPRRLGTARTIEVPIAELSVDTVAYFDREGIQIAVVYTDKVPKVFDAACTHLGCLTAWDPNAHMFRCPCHGAVFDDQGAVVTGPASKPLKKIRFEVKDGKIIIS